MKRKLLAIFVIAVAVLLCACKPTPPRSYGITIVPSEHGSVVAHANMQVATEATAGTSVILVVTADEKYQLASLTINDVPFEGNRFVMPAEEVIIRATFERITYAVTTASVTGGTITVDKPNAAEGEVVTIVATALDTHALVEGSLTVDGEPIVGNTFVMPAHAVTVSGQFVEATSIDESPMSVSIGATEARFYARYDEAGIFITAKVLDDEVVTNGVNFGYDDNVEILIGRRTTVPTWEAGYMHRFLMGACGKVLVQRAVSATTYGGANDVNIAPGSNLYHSAKEVLFKNGRSGYVVEIYIGYDLLNLTPEEAYGNLAFAAGFRDTRKNGNTQFSSANTLATDWMNASTYARILADGTIVSAWM